MLTLEERSQGSILEGTPDERLMESTEDVRSIVEECLSYRVPRLLLYSGNLTERFFDLNSGEAGAILQKLFQYRIRVAIVRPPDAPPLVRVQKA